MFSDLPDRSSKKLLARLVRVEKFFGKANKKYSFGMYTCGCCENSQMLWIDQENSDTHLVLLCLDHMYERIPKLTLIKSEDSITIYSIKDETIQSKIEDNDSEWVHSLSLDEVVIDGEWTLYT